MWKSNKWLGGFLSLWLILSALFNARADAQSVLIKDVLDASGGTSTSSNFKLLTAAGQPTPIGVSQSTNFKVSAGFLASAETMVEPICDPLVCDGPAVFPTPEGGSLGQPIQGRDGDMICIDIRLKENTNPIDAFGFTVNVDPSHLSFVSAEEGDLTSGWTVLDANENPPNSGMIVCGGFHTTPIPPNSAGVLIHLCFEVTCSEGDTSEITITGLSDDVATFNGCCNIFECVTCVSDGDVNGDGNLTPGDALCAFQIFLNAGNLPAECDVEGFDCELVAADVNCDNSTTPGDALAIFERFLAGQGPQECFAQTSVSLSHRPSQPYRLSFDQRIVVQSREADGRDVVKLSLQVEKPAGLRAFGVELSYPHEQLEFIRVERGSLTKSWRQLDGRSTEPGVLTLGGFNLEPLEAAASKDLLHVLFAFRSETPSFSEKEQPGRIDFGVTRMTDDLSQALHRTIAIGAAEATPQGGVPTAFKLYQSFPNPLQGRNGTEIRFDLAGNEAVKVELLVYNVAGQLVRRLISGTRIPGAYEIVWDGHDEHGRQVPSGTYVYRLKAGDLVETKRMTVVR